MDRIITPLHQGSGFVCVLTHPATTQGVQVHATATAPKEFAQWLASRDGLIEPYTVAGDVSSDSPGPLAAIAQLHIRRLASLGQRVTAESATGILQDAAERLKAFSPEDAHSLVAAGDALTLGSSPTPTEKLRSAELKAYAFQLGDPLAGYAAAEEYLNLYNLGASSGFEPGLLAELAAELYTRSAEAGVARAWADLAILRHYQNNPIASKSCWAFYFSAFREESAPDSELKYLTEVLYTHYYSKEISAPFLTFLSGEKLAVQAGIKTFPKDYAYHQWLRTYCWTTLDRTLERLRLPAATALGVILLYLASPAAALSVVTLGITYWFFMSKRRNRKLDSNKKSQR